MDTNQLKGMADRALAVLATTFLGWCVKKGYIGESDAATLLPTLVLLPSLAWGWWKNRPQAVLASVPVADPKAIVVTDSKTADSIPSPNVVSRDDVKVVSK
jgi:hypothetical protein